MKPILKTFLFLLFSTVSLNSFATEKILRWGSDADSGAPFVFRSYNNPNKVIGLDVDIINAVAAEIGMQAEFIQNNWDGLVPGLQSGNYDVIVDGLEIIDDRKNSISFSDPYYYTYEQLVVNKLNEDIKSVEDLSDKKVGTLPASLAYRILDNIGNVNIKFYDEELNAYNDLAQGNRLDAVLLDFSIAQYYAKPNDNLKYIGKPIGRMLYGIGLRKNDDELRLKINTAIKKLIANGELRRILEKWGLWNIQTASAWHQSTKAQTEAIAYNNYLNHLVNQTHISTWDKFKRYISFVPLLLKGSLVTICLSIVAMLLAMALGLMLALIRLYGHPFLARIALIYTELIRGTPLLIQLYLIFYGLPFIGIKFSPFTAAVLGLGLNYAANEAENYRAGIQAVPHSQMDAAYAVGMTRFQALRHIIVPQAVRIMIPPVTNDFIALIKDSSLVSVITLVELTTVYNQLASTYFDYLGIGLLAAAMYFLVGLPFARLSRYAELRLSLQRRIKKRSNSAFPKETTNIVIPNTSH